MANEPVKANNKNGTEVLKISSEPEENDPCIRNEENGKKKFWEDTEIRLREKTGLSQKWLYIVGTLLLVQFVFLIVIIVFAVLWPRIPHHQQFPVCSNPSCLRAAAQVQESLNTSASPCTDIWTWACGGWLSKNLLPPYKSVWNPREQSIAEGMGRIRNMVTTVPPSLVSASVEWKMKHLYEACLEVDNVNADQERPLTTVISELGGWSILRDWSWADFDAKKLLTEVHVEHGTTPYFQISVQPDPRMPGSNSITISPSGLGLPDRSFYYREPNDPVIEAYKELMRDVAMLLSTTRVEAEKFASDNFHYEKRIAEITPYSFNMTNPIYTYNPVRLSELKITAASLPLQDILMAMFPKSGISEDTEVIITSHDYLMKVSQIVSTTDRPILNSYVIWTLVKNYLPFLSHKFTSALDSFHFVLKGIRQPLKRWEKCVDLLHQFMALGIEAKLQTQNPVTAATETVLQNIFKEITLSANNKLKLGNYKTLPILQKHLQKKISTLKLQIGLPLNVTNDDYLKEKYTKLTIIKAHLFESYKLGLNFLKKNQEERLVSPHIYDDVIQKILISPHEISYSAATNTIVVPLRRIHNFDQHPSSITYGQFGVEMAEAIISSILPFESAWTSDMKLLSPFHSTINDSLKSIEKARSCLGDFTRNLVENLPNVEEISLNTLKHLSAINIAHEAMQRSLNPNRHIHQPSLENFEDSGVFFLTYAQTCCENVTKQQSILDNVLNYKLPDEVLLKIAWQQISDFATSLDCNFNEKRTCNNLN